MDDADAPATWTMFDPDGTWLGEVELPAGLRVTDIGDDYVLGIWRDDLGVQRVRQHPPLAQTFSATLRLRV